MKTPQPSLLLGHKRVDTLQNYDLKPKNSKKMEVSCAIFSNKKSKFRFTPKPQEGNAANSNQILVQADVHTPTIRPSSTITSAEQLNQENAIVQENAMVQDTSIARNNVTMPENPRYLNILFSLNFKH